MDLTALSDDALTEHLRRAEVVRSLMEVDRRRLYAAMGYHSLFDYCVRFLGYSEDETAKRIHAARAAEKFPSIVTRLEEGKTKREVQMIVARLDPKPEVAEVVRHLPGLAQPRPEIKPLAPENIRLLRTHNQFLGKQRFGRHVPGHT